MHLSLLFLLGAISTITATASPKVLHFENTKQINRSGQIHLYLDKVSIERDSRNQMGFAKIAVENMDSSHEVGGPELPKTSFLLIGKPEDISVEVKANRTHLEKNTRPFPVQEQPCRCVRDQTRQFQFNVDRYREETKNYELTYLGAFRGQPVSRLDVSMALYHEEENSVEFQVAVEVVHNTKEFELPREEHRGYLIITPDYLADGVEEFALWRRLQGFNVEIETLSEQRINPENIKGIVREHYQQGADFVILIGSEKELPMAKDYDPSDLEYFLMDGEGDWIPDLFYGRIAAADSGDVARILNKSIRFEEQSASDLSGLGRVIGIASNEGYGPSDDEYVRSIEARFAEVMDTTSTHLYQNDQASNPKSVLQAYDQGALWLTYMGHGDGFSWPSMYESFENKHIAELKNPDVVMPVMIDVACQNGRVRHERFGAKFMAEMHEKQAFGATAYYGGTVDVAWHPPAIMARGIVYQHLEKNFEHLGEALLAGQLYLAENWSSTYDYQDNVTWYHLQGDPGMWIKLADTEEVTEE